MKIKKRKPQTRRQRIAALRLTASILRRTTARTRQIRDLLDDFQVQTGFMMHRPCREYDDSDAAKALVRLGRIAMPAIADTIDTVFGSDDYGYTGTVLSHEWYWRTFLVWTFLVGDSLRGVGRHAPYSNQTPYGYQDMRVYAAACRQCAMGVPQTPQIHKVWAEATYCKQAA